MFKELIKLGKKENIDIEIKETSNESAFISIRNGEKEKYEVSSSKKYHLKALFKNKTINLSLTPNCLKNSKNIISKIKKNAKIIDEGDISSLAKESIQNKSKLDTKVELKTISEKLLKLEELKSEFKELTNMEIELSYSHNKITIVNDKVKLEDESVLFTYGAELVINKNNKNQTAWYYTQSKKFDYDKFRKNIILKIKEAIDKTDAMSLKSDRYNIVLKGECVFDLLRNASVLFNAENINKNLSCLTGKFNKRIFSTEISIIEDPCNNKYPGKRLFDDEGTKTKKKTIVDSGVFKVKLYDNKTALKDKTKSTGNSFGVRNIYIKPGSAGYEELIKKCKNGILIDFITGLHSGFNKLTGEFSLQAQGYIIKNGKLSTSLKQIILSSNIFEIFSNVKEVGSDLEFNSVIGGCPSLLINNIAISGSEE